MFNKELDLNKHICKIFHLIILCGVWGIGKVVILMCRWNVPLSPKEIVKALLEVKQGWINSLWFLGALVCIYIFFPLLKTAYDQNKKFFAYFITVCAILTFGKTLLNESAAIFPTTILRRIPALQSSAFFNMFNPFRGIYGYTFVYFCVGGCFYQIKDKILKIETLKRNIAAILIILANCICLWGIGICYSKTTGNMWDVVWNGYDTVFTLVNVICLFVLCLNLKKDIAIIRTISCNTLGIYFIHEIFIHLTRNSIEEYHFFCNVPFNIVYAIVILLICLIISLVMRKIPLIKRLVS